MDKKTGKTAGELTLEASRESSKIDPLEVGHEMAKDVLDNIWECIDKHKPIINEDEFCVVMILADDPLIHGVMRRKFYAWPYLPKPRPRQSVFLYERKRDDIQFLWALPAAEAMATLSTLVNVGKQWQRMKGWIDAFYAGKFFEHIRKQAGISLPSESEYLNANREKLIQAGCQEPGSSGPEPLDLSKISI